MTKGKFKSILSVLGLMLFIGLVAFMLYGGDRKQSMEPVTGTLYAMDTYMQFSYYAENGEEIMAETEAIVKDLEHRLSVRNRDSEVAALNANRGGKVSEIVAELLTASDAINLLTDGAFDITVYPAMRVWGFDSGEYRVPAKAELDTLAAYIGAGHLQFEASGNLLVMEEGTEIDVGGIAKGYAADLIAEAAKNRGCTSAILNLGGNVQTIGSKPDGSDWKIAIRDPKDDKNTLCIVNVSDKAVVTSGGYERFFEENGVVYHHIMDPATLKPAESGVISATIITDRGTFADGLSTALFVMGLDKAAELWRQSDIKFEFVILTEDGLYVTSGLKGKITSQSKITYIE